MRVKIAAWVILLIAPIALLGWRAVPAAGECRTTGDCPPCGPDLCLNDPRFGNKLSTKKAAMKRDGFPDELISLLDRDGKCVMAIDQSPDIFTILLVDKNGTDSRTVPWTAYDEELAKQEILRGEIGSYYKYNTRVALACCNEPKAQDRPDWDKALGLSKNLAIHCAKSGGAVQCQ